MVILVDVLRVGRSGEEPSGPRDAPRRGRVDCPHKPVFSRMEAVINGLLGINLESGFGIRQLEHVGSVGRSPVVGLDWYSSEDLLGLGVVLLPVTFF